jgi:molecular chaperone DnaJ
VAKRDCYDVLGVPRSASKDDIKKAYRKLALKYHPDKTKGDKTSEEKFKEASEAYHILSDEKRKANYDQFGHAAFEGGGGGQGFGGFDTSSFSDIFEDFFSDFGGSGSTRRSSNRGNDLRYDVNIGLEEAYKGVQKNVRYTTYKSCSSCSGSGAAKGSKPLRCDYCSGRGKVRTNQGFFTVQQTCPQCSGYGEMISDPCNKCSGNGKVQSNENVTVKVPKGVDDGTRIRVAGKGEAGSKGGAIMIFLKELTKICITNFPFHLQTPRLEHQSKYHQLTGVNQKLKFQLAHNTVNSLDLEVKECQF